ncbi:hypothetical protein [Sphingomonas sp.]|uniref:hypothetical protein n=1 Tax=Sphingomonas sp. TaxID=28214 RepID=UPI002ED98C87
MAGVAVGALAACALAVAPASGATERQRIATRAAPIARLGSTFTPAAADPRLAAVFARSGLTEDGFRFTPAQTRSGGRAITVAVRARTTRALDAQRIAAAPSLSVGLAPIAYNLGVAVGWKRFAVSGDVKRVDAGIQPGSREAFDLGVSYTGKRFGARVKAAADRPLEGITPVMIENVRTYSVDVGGSYALTRNLDVTAGMRYRTDRERLARLADDRRDSRAVYVGTAFRF